MKTKSIAEERLVALKTQIQQIMLSRLDLIDLTKKAAAAANVAFARPSFCNSD